MSAEGPTNHQSGLVSVRRYLDVVRQDGTAVDATIDEIFFEASSVQSFADEAARRDFRWRWLGRYLSDEPEHAFVAIADDGGVAGYLVGCLMDPARCPRFSDLVYFRDFADLTPSYPAHLHINVTRERRSTGVGGRLVSAFAAHAHHHGAIGMHVVTGAGMRNVRFYQRLGFAHVGEAAYKGGSVVMLGLKLPI
jgi:GNAT superfamily N-acetyltransferase